MNKRHEPLSKQIAKQEHKEVKKGLKEARTEELNPSSKPMTKAKPSSKRAEKTDLTPAHAKIEGSRWSEVLQKQMHENRLRSQDKN